MRLKLGYLLTALTAFILAIAPAHATDVFTWKPGKFKIFAGGIPTSQSATGAGYLGTIYPISTLGQNTTYTIPDPGSSAANFVISAGTQTISGTYTFANDPIAPGYVLTGTSHNGTLSVVQTVAQATSYVLDDPGAATGYVPILASAQANAGYISRADCYTVTGSTIWRSILSAKNLNGTTMAAAAGAGVFGLSTTATFGSPAQLSLLTEAANSNTKTDACEFEVILPPNYVAGSAITVAVDGSVTIGSGTLSVQSLTCDAFLVAAAGTVGSNLGPAAQNLVNAGSVLSFSITPTGLVAGNKLLIQLETILTETSGHNVTANLNDIAVTTSTQM